MWRLLRSAMICVAMAMGISPSAVLGGVEECVAAVKRGDYEIALEECRTAAKQGNATAQFNLGLIYRKGNGVERDDEEAARWYRNRDTQVHSYFSERCTKAAKASFKIIRKR